MYGTLQGTDNSVRISDAIRSRQGRPREASMPYYRSVGEVPRKRHTQFRQPDGSLYAEELMVKVGFSSDSSLLYPGYAPTAIMAAVEFTPPAVTRTPNLPLKPRRLRTHKLDTSG